MRYLPDTGLGRFGLITMGHPARPVWPLPHTRQSAGTRNLSVVY
jgi:hypothetical protein